ncbi:MAG: hypothetical protein BIFFINMI_02724 [Phycisphaerae bacterium]|nr:hypothetical protein [Phycisphaerae bacterium]
MYRLAAAAMSMSLLVVPIGLADAADAPGTLTAVQVRNLAGGELKAVPVTFGQAFARGDVPVMKTPGLAGGGMMYQVDVKRHYDDGSVRFAVISLLCPTLDKDKPASADVVARPEAPSTAVMAPVMLDSVLKAGFDATVKLTFPDGKVRTVSARALLDKSGGKAETWLRGPVCSEWLVAGSPADADGDDPDLEVRFAVRAYVGERLGEIGWVRVSVTVENCRDTWAGNIRYDASVLVGGKEVFTAQALDHRPLSRWRKVFWCKVAGNEVVSADAPAVQVVHDLAYLSHTGALPNYDRTLKVSEQALDRLGKGWTGPRTEIMGIGYLTAYMPTTGGRGEIGSYPNWAVEYLLSMDPRAEKVVMGQGDLAGSWPIHVRAAKTGRVMTIDDRPKFWLDGRGSDKPKWQPDRTPAAESQQKLDPDTAHVGSFAYVPYLVSGDHYYLDEAYFWANYGLLATWDAPRGGARGILAGQCRGNAWCLRNLADAEWIAPDGSPEQKYFAAKIASNIADRIERAAKTEAQGNKLHAWYLRDMNDARIHNPANPDWMVNVPWELDYLTWSFHHLVELGWTDAAKFRDWLLVYRIGLLTHRDQFDPGLAAPYRLVAATRDPKTKEVHYYQTWADLDRENKLLYKTSEIGGDYAYSALAVSACAVDGRFPKSDDAYGWLRKHLFGDGPYKGSITWAIVPGGATAAAGK